MWCPRNSMNTCKSLPALVAGWTARFSQMLALLPALLCEQKLKDVGVHMQVSLAEQNKPHKLH